MRGNNSGVSLAQEVEGARPQYGYLQRGASSVGRWSCRKFESEFYVQTYQEHGAWRLTLRVGRRADEEVEAERNKNLSKLQRGASNLPIVCNREIVSGGSSKTSRQLQLVQCDVSDARPGTHDVADCLRLTRIDDASLDGHRSGVGYYLELEVSRGRIHRQVRPDAARQGKVDEGSLTIGSEQETLELRNGTDNVAGFLQIHLFQVQHKVVKGGIRPIQVIEKLGPLVPLLVHLLDVGNGFLAAAPQAVQHLVDAELHGSNDAGTQDVRS